MKNILHILCTLLITLAAIVPSGLVVCEKNGSVSIEFENGEVCSCDTNSIDMAEKFCCEDTECHEDEDVTSECHEENQLSAQDCNDTRIEAIDALKYFSNSIKAPVKIFKASESYLYSELTNRVTYGLNSPMDIGENTNINEIPNQALTLKKTSVFII